MHLYFIGETDQSKLLETIQVHVKPGHSMRPPHKHSEEEILLVLEGDGEFLVDGKPIACLAEAMLYAAPGTIYIDQGRGVRLQGSDASFFGKSWATGEAAEVCCRILAANVNHNPIIKSCLGPYPSEPPSGAKYDLR